LDGASADGGLTEARNVPVSASPLVFGAPLAGLTEVVDGGPNWATLASNHVGFGSRVGGLPWSASYGGDITMSVSGLFGGVDIPASAVNGQAQGVQGVVRSASTTTAAVGILGCAFASATDFYGLWGGASLAVNGLTHQTADGDGINSNLTIYGFEVDLNIKKTGAAAYLGGAIGLQVTGGSEAQVTGICRAIQIDPLGTFAGVPWKEAIHVGDGAAIVGAYFGAAGVVASSASVPLQFGYIDSGAVAHTATINVSSTGAMSYASPSHLWYDGTLTLMAELVSGIGLVMSGQNRVRMGSFTLAQMGSFANGDMGYCTDADTPASVGAVATAVGDHAGAFVVKTRGQLRAF
jgi:hypothetical protein